MTRLAFSSFVVLGTLVTTISFAQSPAPGSQGVPGSDRMHSMMGGPKMHEHRDAMRTQRHQKHLDEMKVYLQLQAHQETAWLAFSGAMKTPMKRPAPIITSELEKMTTPERIDKMMALKAERDTEMTNRMIASKTFYGS